MENRNEINPESLFVDWWKVIRSRLKYFLIPIILIPAFTLIKDLVIQDPIYESSTTIRIREPDNRLVSNTLRQLPTEVATIKSRTVIRNALQKVFSDKKYTKYLASESNEQNPKFKGVKKAINIQMAKQQVNMIEVSAKAKTPTLASSLANAIAEAAINYNLEFKRREARQVKEYTENELLKVAEKLKKAEENLYGFLKQYNIVELKPYINSPTMGTVNILDPLAQIENEILPLRAHIASLSETYTNSYPELQKARAALKIREDYKKDLEEKFEKLPDRKLEYIAFLRDVEVYAKDYETLAMAAQRARLEEVSVVSDYVVVDKAYAPIKAAYPKVLRDLVLSLFAAIMLGIGVVFFLDHFDRSIKDAAEVEQILSLSTLGEIPYSKQATTLNDLQQRLVTQFRPKDMAAESFRQLYTNLSYTPFEGTIKTITISSSGASEGKTTVAINLAVVSASLGNRVLVVDADLRKPIINKLFSISSQPGLSDVLTNKADLFTAIKETMIPNFYILPSGHLPSSPILLLNSPKFKSLVLELKDKFDLVIFDSAPINVAADTPILASKTDAILLVINQGKTDIDAALKAVNTITNVKAKILGAILNDKDAKSLWTEKSYQYNYYAYTEDESQNKRKFKDITYNSIKGLLKNNVLSKYKKRTKNNNKNKFNA